MRLAIAALVIWAGCEHGKGGGGLDGACDGLTLLDCRNTPGCQADLCDSCFCSQAYRGCIAEGATPAECPQLGCPSSVCCETQEDCSGGAQCEAPGTPPGCGACNVDPSSCATDDDCTGIEICEPIRCSCEGNLACTAGCATDVDCEEGTVCDQPSSRCIARRCELDDDCPSNFDCDGVACARRSCVDDLACDGFCVLGQCFPGSRGACSLPVP